MGYTTTFDGRIEIQPPLNAAGRRTLKAFSDAQHRDRFAGGTFPSIHCDFTCTDDGSAIVWNGSEKTYSAEEWVRHIVDNWVHPTGRKANGELIAQGENPGDVWKLQVVDNVVTRVEGRMVFEPTE